MRFSKKQLSQFDEIERAKYYSKLHAEFRTDCHDMSDSDYDQLFEHAKHGCRYFSLGYDDTIRDYIFLCLENQTALHHEPTFIRAIEEMEKQGYPREEVISGIANKTRRDQELL